MEEESERGERRKGAQEKRIEGRYASAFRKRLERPTFESDWDMHVLLFFLVPTYLPTYLRKLNASAADKTIRASLRNDKLSLAGRKVGGSPHADKCSGSGNASRARMHLGIGGERRGELVEARLHVMDA